MSKPLKKLGVTRTKAIISFEMNGDGKNSDTNFQVPALERGLMILELLAKHPEGLRLRDIAEKLDIPNNSAFRTTGALETMGYLERDEHSKHFRLTRKLLALGYAAIGDDRLVEQAIDIMKSLRDELKETILLGIRQETEGLVLEQVASPLPVKFLVDPGTRFPLHCSAPGKAILAYLPQEEGDAVLADMEYTRYNARTLDSRAKLEQELPTIKRNGYALDHAEQIEGLHCVGAPVFNHYGYPDAAIWATGPSSRFTKAKFADFGQAVTKAAMAISHRRGYRPK